MNLLAHEDIALKAYFETRSRYLRTLPARAAFNQIGEVLPTICHHGRVIGTWTWDEHTRRVTPRITPARTARTLREAVRMRAEELTRILRAGWTSARTMDARAPDQACLPLDIA